VALGATFSVPVTGGSGSGTLNTWTIANTPGLTADMLRNINRIEVVTSSNNQGRGLSLYAQGAGTGWWDDTHITELGLQGGRLIFQMEWKRDVYTRNALGQEVTPGSACGFSLTCSWWNASWSTVRGTISAINLIYNEPLTFVPISLVGTSISAPSNPNAGDVNGDGVVNAADVTMLRRYIAAGNSAAGLNGFVLANADVTGTGTANINALDVAQLRRRIAAANPESVTLGPSGGYVPIANRPRQRNAKWDIVLTIDDGPVWGPSTTGSTFTMFEALANAKAPDGTAARATWFVCGRRLTAQNVPLIQRMVSLGHDIENHTWGHGNNTAIPCTERPSSDTGRCPDPCPARPGRPHWINGADQSASNVASFTSAMFTREIVATSDRIEDITGRRPLYFRFPQFAGGSHVGTVESNGMRVIHAQMDSRDFTTPAISSLVNLLRNGGAIDGENYGNIDLGGWNGVNILFHDAGGDGTSNMYTQNNAQVFAQAIPYLQSIGYAFVTIEEKWRRAGTTPGTGQSQARTNGHTGARLWQNYYPGPANALAAFRACSAGTVCANTRCP
jgi:peptidoglycan/xylan/chitin deacetylase (PgdA/CDA1 family)